MRRARHPLRPRHPQLQHHAMASSRRIRRSSPPLLNRTDLMRWTEVAKAHDGLPPSRVSPRVVREACCGAHALLQLASRGGVSEGATPSGLSSCRAVRPNLQAAITAAAGMNEPVPIREPGAVLACATCIMRQVPPPLSPTNVRSTRQLHSGPNTRCTPPSQCRLPSMARAAQPVFQGRARSPHGSPA